MRIVGFLLVVITFFFVNCEFENEFEFDSDCYHSEEASPLVLLPDGSFVMGTNRTDGIDLLNGHLDEPFEDEHPQHAVQVSSFWLEKTEVSNVQYRACVHAGACEDPHTPTVLYAPDYYTNSQFDNYPVVNVTWNMADDYCTWRNRRLPTEAEWEKAARGDLDERIYPWGWQEPLCSMANVSIIRWLGNDDGEREAVENCHGFPVPVASYTDFSSPYGLLNMTGNVEEWVADYYSADYYNSDIWPGNGDDPAGPDVGEEQVVRGGSFSSSALFARITYRDRKPLEYYSATVGFRCATDGN